MSLYIDVDSVTAVLIGGEWYSVLNDSFDMDSYEFHHKDYVTLGGGREPLIPATGFTFETDGGSTLQGRTLISGPLTSIQAVAHRRAGGPNLSTTHPPVF